tara:strand:+ start:5380 stop:5859 length:480 start_codon:yes stop_codon:yes gene_type:complete
MKDILFVVLIFLFLGIFLSSSIPIFEGLGCKGGYRYDKDGEEGNLGEQQKNYNECKEENIAYKKTDAYMADLISENSASINTYKNDKMSKRASNFFNEFLEPSSNDFNSAKQKYTNVVDSLLASSSEEGKKPVGDKKCGGVDDAAGASPDGTSSGGVPC